MVRLSSLKCNICNNNNKKNNNNNNVTFHYITVYGSSPFKIAFS